MGNDWGLFSGVVDRLLHGGEHVQVLNAFHFEVHRGQFRTNDIGIPCGTAILLTAKCFEESGLAELIPPEPLDPFALLPGIHGNALPIRPCAQRTISSSA